MPNPPHGSRPGRRPGTRLPGRRAAVRLAAAVAAAALLAAGCVVPPDQSRPVQAAARGNDAGLDQPAVAAREGGATPTTPTAAAPPPARPAPPVRPAAPPAVAPRDPAPRLLTVAGTTIRMRIVEVGVSRDGAMEIPDPFEEAGWYRFGPAPGAAAGAAVLAAHVDTTSEAAPFSQLKTLPPGTLVTVDRHGAPPVRFRVVRVELMAKDAFDGAAVFRRGGPHELKLVTCGGRWLDEQQNYGDNVIVTALPA